MKNISFTEVQSVNYTRLLVLQDLTLVFLCVKPVLNLKMHNKSRAPSKHGNQKCKKYDIKFPPLSMDDLKLQLLTDTSFNNLPNGGSQAGKILFLTNNKKIHVLSTGIHSKLRE